MTTRANPASSSSSTAAATHGAAATSSSPPTRTTTRSRSGRTSQKNSGVRADCCTGPPKQRGTWSGVPLAPSSETSGPCRPSRPTDHRSDPFRRTPSLASISDIRNSLFASGANRVLGRWAKSESPAAIVDHHAAVRFSRSSAFRQPPSPRSREQAELHVISGDPSNDRRRLRSNQSAGRHLQRDGPHLQGPVRPRSHPRTDALVRRGRPHVHPRGDAHAGRAQPRRARRAPAPARHADVLPVRDRQRVLRAGRTPHRAHCQGVHQRHRHRRRGHGARDVHPACRRLRRALAHEAERVLDDEVVRRLAEVYRRFGEAAAAEASPLYERVAVALSESDEALRAIEAAPARKRHPTAILAALHDLALAGRAPALAAAYAAGDGDAAAGAAIDTLPAMTDSVAALAVRRPVRANETGRCAVLYPAIAEAARA